MAEFAGQNQIGFMYNAGLYNAPGVIFGWVLVPPKPSGLVT